MDSFHLYKAIGLIFFLDDKSLHLVWSDPDDITNWYMSPRGAGWLFGSKVTNDVCFLIFYFFLWNPCGWPRSILQGLHYSWKFLENRKSPGKLLKFIS